MGTYNQEKMTIRSAIIPRNSSMRGYLSIKLDAATRSKNNEIKKIKIQLKGSRKSLKSYPGEKCFRTNAQIVQKATVRLPCATNLDRKNFPGRIKLISRINPNSRPHSIRANANTYEARKNMSDFEWEYIQLGIWKSIR
jgi:hypothetical protein